MSAIYWLMFPQLLHILFCCAGNFRWHAQSSCSKGYLVRPFLSREHSLILSRRLFPLGPFYLPRPTQRARNRRISNPIPEIRRILHLVLFGPKDLWNPTYLHRTAALTYESRRSLSHLATDQGLGSSWLSRQRRSSRHVPQQQHLHHLQRE